MSHPAATGAPPVVAVVGGGITGLAGALALADGGARVVLLEASGRLGGKIRTEDFGGQPVEAGPDAFLARVPHAVELCKRLGLADDLVSPATGKASLWVRGRLRPLPSGLVLGVPTRWAPLARSGILSPAGLARAVLDLVMPASAAPEDRSVGDLVGSRLGSQVADRLVGPLVGGINAGDAATLSAAAAAPVLDAAARRSRSLVLGLRHPPTAAPVPAAARFGRVCVPMATTNTTSSASAAAPPRPAAPPAAPPPVFLTHPAGLSTLVEALTAELASNTELRTNSPVTALSRSAGGGWLLATPSPPSTPSPLATPSPPSTPSPHPGPSEQVEADAVLLAVPAFEAAPLLAPHAPGAAALLSALNYASVALVTLAYPESALTRPLHGSGYLVPAGEGRMTTACTFTSRKGAQVSWRDHEIFRASVGRWGDSRHQGLGDAELVALVASELAEAVGIHGPPVADRVSRWPLSFPQYAVGHLDRVARIEAELAGLGTVAVAGAAYRGVGIPACIAGAQDAAAALLGALRRDGGY
ncbi:MAG: protoporphyrinogen oxidase [Acidimicrobiales bacterium]